MILIVEGSNKVGKTTFIEKLIELLEEKGIRTEIQNKRPAKNDKYEVTKEKMADITISDFINALRKSLRNIDCKYLYIFDRSYISEYIYGKKYRDYENDEVMKLDRFISEIPFVEQVFLASNYKHIEDKTEMLNYLGIQYDMMCQVMKCKSCFDVQFIEDENSVENFARAYANSIERKINDVLLKRGKLND